MADNPQLVRPENQLLNPNRQTLNIAQPAESQTQGPSFDFSTVPLAGGGSASDPNNPSIGLGDIGRAIAAAPLDLVHSIGQDFKAGNTILDLKNQTQAPNNPNPLGLSDQEMAVIRTNNGGPLANAANMAVEKVGDWAGQASDAIKSGYSEGARQAVAMPIIVKDAQGNDKLGPAVFNKNAWIMNAGPIVTQLMTAGAIARLGFGGAINAVEHAVFNRLSTTLPEAEARKVAQETAELAAKSVAKTTFAGTMAASAQGQAGLDMRSQKMALPFEQLSDDPAFKSVFLNIDSNPANANLTNAQKLDMARSQFADQAAAAVTADPRLAAANVAAAALGDQQLLSLLTKKGAATGIASGITSGVLAGGLSGFGQGAVQQYVENKQTTDANGQPIDPMQNVVQAGLSQGVMGAGIGGVAGVVGGIRGRNTQPPQETLEPGATPADNGAASADNTATSSAQPQLSPYDAARQQLSTMGRDDVLRQYASADLSGNADVKAAANDRLAEIDRADKVTQAADKFSQQPESDLLATYRDLSEKANRSDEDEVQLEAARSVLTNKLGIQPAQTQAAATPAAGAPEATPTQPVQPPIESTNGVPNSRVDAFRDTPAYARQDPRVQGFADNSEVQQALGRPGAPAPEQLVQQQMQGGNQGYTPEEQRILDQAEQIQADRARREAALQQAATPRLPAPGDINPGRGYPMPGPVMQDEAQAGQGPQFNAGEQVRGKPLSSDKKPQAQGNEENSQPAETEPVGTSAEPAGGQVATPVNDEPVGQLKLFAKDQPYSNERVASASKWAKLPGATVEKVGDGYGVRLPPEETNPAGENAQPNAAESSPQGELKLMTQNQPFSTERVAKASKWGKTSGAVVEKVGDGYGVRLPKPDISESATYKSALGEGKWDPIGEAKPTAAMRKPELMLNGLTAEQFVTDRMHVNDPTKFRVENVDGKYYVRGTTQGAGMKQVPKSVHDLYQKVKKVMDDRPGNTDNTLYSRSSESPGETPLKKSDVEEEVANFQKEYNGNIPLKFKIGQSQEDVYGPDASAEKLGYRIQGGYNPKSGTIGIVADNVGRVSRDNHLSGRNQGTHEARGLSGDSAVSRKGDLRRTLRHEILGHYGLNTFKSADKTLVLESILKTKDDPKFKILWQQVEKNYSDKSPMVQAEEAFALAAEQDRSERNARSGNRIIPASVLHAFQMALRRAGLVKGPMKIGELYDAVDAVSDGIRNGRRTQQIFPATDQDQFRREENASESGGVPANGTDIGGGNVITNDSFTPSEENPDRGMRQPEAQYVADQWVRGMNGAAKIKVKVVQTQAEAADMMPNGIPKEYGRVNAIYQPELSRVVVVADNIANSKDLRAKLRHEVLAHHGVASVIGDVEYDRIMRVLDQTRDSKNATIRDAWDQVKKSYGDESPEVQANEFLAHMAESSELTGLGGAWDRVVSLITNALRKAGILKPGDISPAEIRNILRTIAGRFRHTKMYDGEQPGTREFDDTFSRTDALYSRAATMKEETDRKMGFTLDQGKIARAKSFYDEMRGKSKDEFKSWLTETGRKLNTKTFDGLAPLKYAEDAAGKSDHPSSAYIGARMAAGSGSVTAATLEHGLPQYNKAEGIIERKAGTGKEDALMGILDSLGSKREDFFKWIAGNRSEQLMKEGREKNFTPQEIAYMKSLRTGNEAFFDAAKKKYDAFTKSILDLQQDMGLIDPDSRAQWENAWYLPYYREAEDGEVTGPWTTRGIANQSSTVRKLKGSEKTIKDPIENLFNYIAKSVDASMKNEAMRRAVVNLADTGVLEVIDNPNKMDYQRLGKGQDVAKVYMDGKEKLIQVNDPDLYRSFTMINMERNKGTFWTAARAAKKVLTISTTAMPDFIIRNFLRDSIHSWAINKDGFRPGIDSWNGLKKALKTDPALVDMMFAGSTFGGGYSNVYDPASTATNIRRILRSKGYTDSQMNQFESSIVRNGKEIMAKVTAGLEKYKHVSEASENANRIATYEAAIRSGKSKAQAAYEARDLMDFGMMGASKIMMDLSDMLPFFNARMQGLGKLGRAIKADPIETLKRGGMVTAATLALAALSWNDKRYDELPDWDKDNYWHAWIGGQHVRFPKPFEIGLMFGTLPERLVRTFAGKDTPAKFGKLVAINFANTMSFNPIPQVALPIAEAFFNYDTFTGNPIENMSDANLIAGARYNDQTSLIAREIGDKLNLSPKMIDHIVNGYTGTLGAYVLGATNIMMRHLGDYGASPALRLDEMPVIKSFFRDDPAKNTQFIEDFYNMMTTANQVYSTINDYRKQGRFADAQELQQENRSELSQRAALTATQLQVRGLNQAIEMVLRDKILTSDEKRDRIDKLMARRNEIVQQTVQRVNPYFN